MDAVAKLNTAHPGLDLHVHIGVTTGEALITFGPQPDESGGLAWGDILNTAARLEAAAPAGHHPRRRRDLPRDAPRHRVRAGRAHQCEGQGRSPSPYGSRSLRVHAVASASERPHAQPLVGRRAELALLLGILDGVRSSRAPQLVTIVGEPGIGKSRLVFELFRRIDEMLDLINFRLGRSPPYPEGVSFWALGEIVKAQAGMLESDGAATAAGKLHASVRDLVPITAEASRIEGHLQALVGLGDTEQASVDQRGAAFAAWRHFLEAIARRRPLVLVFEDVQWADDGLLDFIEHLVGWAREVPILIVATTRPELYERRPQWARQGLRDDARAAAALRGRDAGAGRRARR